MLLITVPATGKAAAGSVFDHAGALNSAAETASAKGFSDRIKPDDRLE